MIYEGPSLDSIPSHGRRILIRLSKMIQKATETGNPEKS